MYYIYNYLIARNSLQNALRYHSDLARVSYRRARAWRRFRDRGLAGIPRELTTVDGM